MVGLSVRGWNPFFSCPMHPQHDLKFLPQQNVSYLRLKLKLLVLSNQCTEIGGGGVFGWTWQDNVPLIRGIAHPAQSSNSQYGARPADTHQPANVPLLWNNITAQQYFNTNVCIPVLPHFNIQIPIYQYSSTGRCLCWLKILPNMPETSNMIIISINYKTVPLPQCNNAFFFSARNCIAVLSSRSRYILLLPKKQIHQYVSRLRFPSYFLSDAAARWWLWVILSRWRSHALCPLITTNRTPPMGGRALPDIEKST